MEIEAVKDTKKTEKQKHGSSKIYARVFGILIVLALVCGAVMIGS